MVGLGLMVFAGVVQPFVLTSLLKVPLAAQGAATGRLGLANELTILLTIGLLGAFSDKIGRKPVYAAGLLLMAAAYFLYPTAGSLNSLVVLRAVFALGAAAFTAMLGTVLADYVANEDRGKAGGIMGVFNGLGAMLAATVFLSMPTRLEARGMETAGALQVTFYIAAGIALVSAAVLWWGLKPGVVARETEHKSLLALAREGIGAARDPGIALAYAAAFVSRGDLALVGQFLLLWVNKYGIESGLSEADARKQAQLAFIVPQAAALLAAPLVGLLSDRLNRATAVMLMVGVSAVGYSSLFFIANPLSGTMKLALLVVGVGEIGGVVASQALIAQQAPRAIRGSVIGVFGFCGALGILVAFGFGGYLFDHWREPAPFLMFGVFGAIVAAWGFAVSGRVKPPRENWIGENGMATIVVTGSTRGIGYGLAHEFLQRGCQVVVSGRGQAAVDKAVSELAAKHGAERVKGFACDVTDAAQVQGLWDAAKENFGRVDVWVNNAGISNPYVPFWEVTPETLAQVVNVNLTGAMYGCQVAMRGMLAQGDGHIYIMEGFGSDGRTGEGLGVYGSSKAGLRYFLKAMLVDAKGRSVKIGALSPGMVVTDLWDELYEGQPERFEKAKKIVNILGDKVETVTPWLAEQVLANNKNGASFKWLTTPTAIGRFLKLPFKKRDLFAD